MLLAPALLVLTLAQNPARPVVRPRPAPAVNPSLEFSRGRTAFNRGEYARAIELLRPLLYPENRLESEGEIASAHRMLGVAHLYERQNDEAAEEFRKLLQLRPDYRMDRLLDPPMVVDFFNNVLKEQEVELAELERRRSEAQENERRRLDALRAGPTFVIRNYDRHSLLVSFLPFGAGQFQNGHRTKGWIFLGSEAALAAVSVGALATNFAVYGARPLLRCIEADEEPSGSCPEGRFKESPERSRSDLLKRVQVLSGALFFATAIWGVTDAVLNYQPRVLIPDDDPPSRRRADSRESRPRLGLAWLGDGPGGSLAFRF